MKIVGVITEYNPLHAGHIYQLNEIRRHSQCDVLVVVMSGNVVQRGEFAIIDKWTRAQLAVEAGADVVFELPIIASLQSADYFAQVGVQLLSHLQCQDFYFGSEEATVAQMNQLLNSIETQKAAIDNIVQKGLNQGMGYAKAYAEAIEQYFPQLAFDMSLANQQLGLRYLVTNRQLEKPMSAHAIPRIMQSDSQQLMSATQIRKAVLQQRLKSMNVPSSTWNALQQVPVVQMEDYWPLLRYRLMTHTPMSLQRIFGIKEGIEYKLLQEVVAANSWQDLVTRMVSKRWTRAAIQRLLMSILGDISIDEMQREKQLFMTQPMTRLLAYRQTSTRYLKELRQQSLHIMNNWKQSYNETCQLMMRMDRIYQLNSVQSIDEQIVTRHALGV
ncbi:nucleotidyltransferase family protein [Aerococcaceae bacterium zg-ZUI334]|uniref:tRNA(Met) cytidine acetate ligase n=1 Tax=Aerococcaceae bacterium zg-252 TaxID=2796928 RepID=UPI001B8DE213|nr:nucleotidyltransferase family protein [Aerococcaceae bacterium zg-ZUI334]